MRYRLAGPILIVLVGTLLPPCGWAADDDSTRLREMLHRTQEALHQAQADNADLSRAKLEAEQKLEDAGKQLASAKTSSKAAQSGTASLKAQLDAALKAQESLQHGLDDANSRLTASTAKLGEMSRQLAARDAQIKDATQSLAQSRAANSSCEAKNLALYHYGDEVLRMYQKKGVWASLTQKEPVLGLKEVDVENTVQEYRLKMEDEKVHPATQPAVP